MILPRLIFAAALALALSSAQAQVSLSGQVRIVDGDTLVMRDSGVRIRLFGMDAPEQEQSCTDMSGHSYMCGLLATAHMLVLVNGQDVICDPQDTDRYGRIVAICYVDKVDLGEAMVRDGWAVDWPYFSHGAYSKAQEEARSARRGIWVGTFDMPWDWRRAHPR